MTVEPEALKTMSRYCGGLPTLAHEIGDAVFHEARTATVSGADALTGIVQAAETIGRKYIGPQALQAIRSKTYRSALMKLGLHGNPFDLDFSRAEFSEVLDDTEKTNLDSFLRRMRDLDLIVSLPERGSYRFANHLIRVFVWLEAVNDRTRRRPGG